MWPLKNVLLQEQWLNNVHTPSTMMWGQGRLTLLADQKTHHDSCPEVTHPAHDEVSKQTAEAGSKAAHPKRSIL